MTPILCGSRDHRSETGFTALKAFIIHATGLAFYEDKDDELVRRILPCLEASGKSDFGSYLDLLESSSAGDSEIDRLVEALTIGETCFFRHTEVFEGLRERVIPELLVQNRDYRRLRIWSAGCSIGAEPYSLAILLAEEFPETLNGWDISILGTDINRKSLARAQAGVYRAWDFRGAEMARIERCFEMRGEEWIIKPKYRKWVNFQYHNLVRHAFPSLPNNLLAFDVILCRNVLMYFSREVMSTVVEQLHASLMPNGWLLVGSAEMGSNLFRNFETVNVRDAVLHRRRGFNALETLAGRQATIPALAPDVIYPTPEPDRIPAASIGPIVSRRQRFISGRARTSKRPSESGACDSRIQSDGKLDRIENLANSGCIDMAIAECRRLAAGDPLNSRLHFHLSMLEAQIGNYEAADAALRNTLYLDPNNALAHYFAGLFRQKRGHRAQALQSFQNVLGCIAARGDHELIAETENMTVRDLRELTSFQREVAGGP